MTTIASAAQAPYTSLSNTAGVPNGNLDKEDFLKLLVAQLSNQDPLSPTDPGEFVAQLSQFSSLEQLMNIKGGLDLVAVTQTAGTSAQMVSFIGKDVEYDGSSVVWSEDQSPVDMRYSLDRGAAEVEVRIADAQGNTLETRSLGARGEGANTFTFDGRLQSGKVLPPGTYTIEVTAKDADGNKTPVDLRSSGRVTGVTFENGYPQLVLNGGRTLGLAQVLEIIEGEDRTAPETPATAPEERLDSTVITDPTPIDDL
jgi:flagellar basal-body rod modification protein FlgD